MNKIKIGSPAHKAGLVIGKQYALRVDVGGLSAGDMVTFTNDDGDHAPRFDAPGLDGDDGWTYIFVSDVVAIPDTRTPAQKAGLVIGDKYKVIGGFDGSASNEGYHSFDKDTIVTFTRDDHSSNPQFYRGTDRHDTQYIHVVDVVEYTTTPLLDKGIKVGDKVKVLKNEGEGGRFFKAGEIVTLAHDDGTGRCEFKYDTREDDQATTSNKQWFTNVSNIELYVETPVEVAAPMMKVEFNTILTFTKVLTTAQIAAIMAIAEKA